MLVFPFTEDPWRPIKAAEIVISLISQTALKLLDQHFIANTNSDIPLETAAIFFPENFYLKHGIGLVNVMLDFICMGLVDMWGAQTEN